MTNVCDCENVHPPRQRTEVMDLGLDRRNGRFGEVTLHRCPSCRAHWLHYQVEYEAFSGSGRWFCGRIADAAAPTASNAIATLAALPWYWAGGSFFDGEVSKGAGAVPVDLYGPPAVE